jgi:hypothetical protein
MPLTGGFLSTQVIDSIRTWVDQGAQDVPATN